MPQLSVVSSTARGGFAAAVYVGPVPATMTTRRCRKHSGSSFETTAGIHADELVITEGKQRLSSWESSPGVHRFFASCCGSPIFKRDDADPESVGFRLGTLDTDPAVSVDVHFMVGSKAPWVGIDDDLPQEAGGPAFGNRD
jgi:hypothetical protein